MQPNNRMETPLSIAFTNSSPKNAEILLQLCQKYNFKPHFSTRDFVYLMNDESLFMMALKSIELYRQLDIVGCTLKYQDQWGARLSKYGTIIGDRAYF